MRKVFQALRKKDVRVFIAAFVVLFLTCELILYTQLDQVRAKERDVMIADYISIQEGINDIIGNYTSLLKGVGAYIQMNDTYDDDEINRLMDLLIGDRRDEFRNVGILKDTTIRWVYPLEGNESAIGVDLSKIEGQAQEIEYVKNTLKEVLVGPVQLVQGGEGFIIRIPIVKNGVYWGMTSFVLHTEVIYDFFDEMERLYDVKLLALQKDDLTPIYGKAELQNEDPLFYDSKRELQSWHFYIVPQNGWFPFYEYFVVLSGLVALLSMFIARRIQQYYRMVVKLEATNEEMIAQSTRDAFTGIFNRRYFNIRVEEEMAMSDRTNIPLSMIYFDLDRFKQINDTYGHATGDTVLLAVTQAVQKILRMNDFFARWGGDEFVIILPDTDLEGAKHVAGKIKEVVNETDVIEGHHLSASIGLAQRVEQEFFASWFNRIDEALYVAKENGRDQYQYSDHETASNVWLKMMWKSTWDSGETSIDHEHRDLVNRGNEVVESSFDDRNYDLTVRKAEEFVEHVATHFDNEVKRLKELGYPKVDEHKDLHADLLRNVRMLYNEVVRKEIQSSELLKFLNDNVVVGHLINEDARYRAFIAKLGK